MAKRKSSIASVLMFLILIVAAVGLVSLFFIPDIFEDNSLIVTIDGHEYKKDASGIFLADGVEIIVSVSDYAFSIYSQGSGENDVVFTVGDELYNWSDLVNRNCTNYFSYKVTDTGFMIAYDSLNAVLANYIGLSASDIQLLRAEYGVSLFVLSIATDAKTINIGFTLKHFTDDLNLMLDIDRIIF